MKVTLLIPVINELRGMKEVMPRIQKDWVDEIIVVDGGSTDGSYEYAKQQSHVITIKQKSRGLFNSYLEGAEIAQGDAIITFSPDGNSVPERIPELVQKIKEGYDMVIVSRYCQGAKSEDDNFITAFGNWFFTQTINLLFRGHFTDSLVIFRAWRKDLLETLNLKEGIPQTGFEPTISIRSVKNRLKIAEIPGDEPDRIDNLGKVNHFYAGLAILSCIGREFFSKSPSRHYEYVQK